MKKNIEEVTLIDGVFNTEDAKELLNDLLNKKIHFHEMKNFSSIQRFDLEDEVAKSKILKLLKSKNVIDSFIESAKIENKKLKVTSTIKIEKG
jgi:hypothetical protein